MHLTRFAKFHFVTDIESTKADPNAIYVLERTGRIWIVRGGKIVSKPFLDVSNDIALAANSEQGLLGLAFAPDYRKSGIYYVYYSNRSGDIRLRQFRRSPKNHNRTLAHSGRTILALRHPAIAHYGGHIEFGKDGHLYIGIGDGGGVGDPGNNAQNIGSLFGKILRIDPLRKGKRKYKIPRSNPFVHRAGAAGEVLAYGLRNPWKFTLDRATGATYIGDVGENNFEEIDYRKRGQLAGINFGWSRYEGYSQYSNRSAPGAIFPIIVEAHSGGPSGTHERWCAIMGGVVAHDPKLSGLGGAYLFADHCTGQIWSTRVSKQGSAYATGFTGLTVPDLVNTFGTGAKGTIYLGTVGGWVYRIDAG
jgi:glucose/arabinose dehydrogenase